jgi:hypothetical protein
MFRYFLFFLLITHTALAQQLNLANQKKFSVYKSAFNVNAVREGTRGLQAVFSCEYFFSDPEYAELTDAQRKTYFSFYLQLFNQNNEPVYYPFDYQEFTKALTKTAIHFSAENAYAPQVKSQGRRNTGIELFIPFAHLDLPEGTHSLTLTVNAVSEKTGKRYENFFTEKINLVKPATFWVQLTPATMAVFRKSGQKVEVNQVEEDVSILRGTNPKYPDICGSGNLKTGKPVSFLQSEGDNLMLLIHKNTRNIGKVADFEVPTLADKSGNRVLNFDNPPQGIFLEVEKMIFSKDRKTFTLAKSSVLELAMNVSYLKIPPVKVSQPRLKPYLTHEGMTGISLAFDYEATLPAGMPPLQIMPAYRVSEENKSFIFKGGESLKVDIATADTSGAVTLLKNSGTAEVFYPFAGLLYFDPSLALKTPKLTLLQARIQGNATAITQKTARMGFQVTVIKNAGIETVNWARDTVFQEERGLKISIPYKLPNAYFRLIQQNFSMKIITGTPDDKGRFATMFKRMTLMNDNAKRLILDTNSTQSVSYQLLKPNASLDLFLPYTVMGQQQPAGLPFIAKILLDQKNSKKPVELGGNESVLNFKYDPAQIRLLTVGINAVRFKKAESNNLIWRIRAEKRVIYQSPVIPVTDKEVKNFYAQYYTIHLADRVVVEVLQGNEAIFSWEMPVKDLSGEKVLTFEEGKAPEIKNPVLKSVELKFSVN